MASSRRRGVLVNKEIKTTTLDAALQPDFSFDNIQAAVGGNGMTNFSPNMGQQRSNVVD